MSVALDATVGGASANTYATLAEAEAYLESRLYADAWTDADTDTKNRALATATRLLDTYMSWYGSPVAPSVQALMWPRYGMVTESGYTAVSHTVLPTGLKRATIETAFRLIENGRMPDRPGDSKGLTALTAGPITLQFDTAQQAGMSDLLAPDVVAMLSAWGVSTLARGMRSVPILRS